MTLRSALLGAARRRNAMLAETVRPYDFGDDARTIDWNASARMGVLAVRAPARAPALRVALWMDGSASMSCGRERAIADDARDAARAIVNVARSDDTVSVLASLDDAARRRSTVLIAISDFFEVPKARLLRALARRQTCVALIPRDPWRDVLPLCGFVRLRDAETHASRLLYVGARERRRYADASRQREEVLATFFSRLGWRCAFFGASEAPRALLNVLMRC